MGTEKKEQRLVSLDVFRGLTVAGMIMVNNPGSWKEGCIYPALEHAKWNGVTPTDLVFPFFLFIVGVAITYSLSKRKERGDDIKHLYMQIFRRTAVLILLGIILNGFPFFPVEKIAHLRYYGVLQRIALVYCASSVIFLKTGKKTQTWLAAAFALAYWAIITLIPVPGQGYASLEPGKDLGAWIDRLWMSGHLWDGTHDPEGLLSTLPAISTCLIGMLTGHWLRSNNDKNEKALRMFFSGNILIFISMFWDMVLPINKNLWSSSYVAYAGGVALIVFSMCYYLVDIKGNKKFVTPALVYGMNAITVYFLSGMTGRIMNLISLSNSEGKIINLKSWLYDSLFTWWLQPVNASFAWAVTYVLFWLGIMWIFYRKKIFIKI
jgi:predicted acyltransferase